MINRDITRYIEHLTRLFPVVVLTGPRQSGKTTLLKNIFKNYSYFNLENPDILRTIEADPGGFLHKNSERVIFDEAQRYPDLFSYVQAISDEKQIPGNFILSGSQNILLSDIVSQSLAGRAAYATLLPLSIREIIESEYELSSHFETMRRGFYPAIFSKQIPVSEYYNQYIATYAERDVKQIVNIKNLNLFRKFMSLLAGRVGSVVNYSSLSNDVGVDHKTIENWLSILDASYITFTLAPFYENFGKRHIKAPKIYFHDTGIVCSLLGIRNENELDLHPLRGGIFENMIISDIMKESVNAGLADRFYFYRSSGGNEVDLIIDRGSELIPVEIKSAQTFDRSFTKGIKYFSDLIEGSRFTISKKYIVFTGLQSRVHDVELISWRDVGAVVAMV